MISLRLIIGLLALVIRLTTLNSPMAVPTMQQSWYPAYQSQNNEQEYVINHRKVGY